MAVQRESKRRKAWSIAGQTRRLPTEYEVVTSPMDYHFRRATSQESPPVPFELDPNAPLNQWYLQYREGSPLQVDDWNAFRDPYQLTYRAYITQQHERELYVDALIDQFESQDHFAKLDMGWVGFLERVYVPTRFSGHVLQMLTLYVGQMAPTAFIINPAHLQAGDAMRAVQRSAYMARSLEVPSEKTRARWEDDEAWQGVRELLERLLPVYDWGEAFAGLNLVAKPMHDAVFVDQIAQAARANGDGLLSLMLEDFKKDNERSRGWTKALVEFAVERREENRAVLKEAVQKWQPLAAKAVETMAPAFKDAPVPMEPDALVQYANEACQSFVQECGLA